MNRVKWQWKNIFALEYAFKVHNTQLNRRLLTLKLF